MTVTTLARILQRAGAVRAMQFDINADWHTLITYTHHHGLHPTQVGPFKTTRRGRYLSPDDRDFFAVYRRQPGPVTVPFNSGSSADASKRKGRHVENCALLHKLRHVTSPRSPTSPDRLRQRRRLERRRLERRRRFRRRRITAALIVLVPIGLLMVLPSSGTHQVQGPASDSRALTRQGPTHRSCRATSLIADRGNNRLLGACGSRGPGVFVVAVPSAR